MVSVVHITTSLQQFKLRDYPALTVGIIPFTLVLLIVDKALNGKLSHMFALDPYAPLRLDLNKLSFYPLYHVGFFHWLLNIVSLAGLLARFEKKHGTIHTGVVLNLLAVTAALQYCVAGIILFSNTHVIGLSGFVFLFFTFYSVEESKFRPVLYTFHASGTEHIVKTIYAPFISAGVCALILPGTSLLGHLAGIGSGFLLAHNKLRILYPPSNIIIKIEEKLHFLIKLLDNLVDFVSEKDAVDSRTLPHQTIWGVIADPESGSNAEPAPFSAPGHVLGQ